MAKSFDLVVNKCDRVPELLHTVIDRFESHIDVPATLFETRVQLFEACVDLFEACVDLFEACVDLLEACVDPLKASVDLFEAGVEPVDQRFKAAVNGRQQILVRHNLTVPRPSIAVKKFFPV